MKYLEHAQEIDTKDMDQLNAIQQIAKIPSAKRLRRNEESSWLDADL